MNVAAPSGNRPGVEALSSALTLAPPPLRQVARLLDQRHGERTAKVFANVTQDDSAADTAPVSTHATASEAAASPTSAGPSSGSPAEAEQRQPDELVVRAQNGDTEAFTALFRRHRSAVTAIAYRMLGPTAELEDVVQDVFLQVHRSLADFRSHAKFSTWLHRVAVNVVLMTRRRAKSRPVYTFEEVPRQEADMGPLPDQHLDKLRRQRAFHQLLDKLSDKKRTVFVLHELEGMQPSEIAKQVGCPVLTVRTRLFYARRELADLMTREPALAPLLKKRASADHREDGQPHAGMRVQGEPS